MENTHQVWVQTGWPVLDGDAFADQWLKELGGGGRMEGFHVQALLSLELWPGHFNPSESSFPHLKNRDTKPSLPDSPIKEWTEKCVGGH